MCFAGWSELGLDAEMEFEAPSAKPSATPFGENCRFRNLDHPKNRNEEMSCPIFFTDQHRQLYMMKARKHDQDSRLTRHRAWGRPHPTLAPTDLLGVTFPRSTDLRFC